jgi:LysR family transcriptional regulator, nitrogen assimilation regulatory protein
MDLKRLRTFVAVAELGTVSRAAQGLRISQSALSRQIADLEQEFGFKLFDRVGRRLVLTAIGEQLLGDCRGVLGHVGSLGERVELLRRGDRGVLKVAAPPQTIESVLSTFLPRYARRFPNVQVKLTEALGPDQSAMLERGEVHVGIRHDQYASRHFASRALPPDEVLAACDPARELGHAGTIELERLASYPLLLLESGYSVRRLFNAACRLAGVAPDILLESRAPHTLLALAEAGHGVAIIPSLLRTDRYSLRIVRVTHRRKPLSERLVIQWDTRRPMPPYAKSFCEALAEYMGEVLPITQPSASKTVTTRKQAAVPKPRRPTDRC